jgi:drug/metabolite transporter (DMT)-like permease
VADIALLVTVLLWGINLPIMKFALGEIDKFAFNAIRLTISTVVLGLIVWRMQASVIDRTVDAKPVGRQWLNILLFAVLTGFGYQVLFLIGIDLTSAGNTGLILSAIPMWTAVLSFIFLRERLSGAAWTGLLVAVSGVLIVTLCKSSSSAANGTILGNVLISCAAFSWAAASVWSMPMMKNISPVALTFYSILFSLPLHWGAAWWMTDGFSTELYSPNNVTWLVLAIGYSGIFSTGVASALWNFGVKKVGPSHAAGFQNLVPMIGLVSSWILLGEVPFALQILGGAFIITGLITMRMWKRKTNGSNQQPSPKPTSPTVENSDVTESNAKVLSR